jgi:integrase
VPPVSSLVVAQWLHAVGGQTLRQKITKSAVDALYKGEFIADKEVKGFIARRLPSGAVTYGLQYRAPTGKRRWLSLGIHGNVTADQARTLAKKRAGEVADRRDPVAEDKAARNIATNTVDAVLNGFMDIYVAENGLRSADVIKSAFDRLVRPEIGTVSIYGLTRSGITKMLDKIAKESGPVMADRVLAYLRKALNWQMARDEQFNSPIIKGMARTEPDGRKRERVLDDEEIRDVWTALNQIGNEAPACYPRFIRALLLSGQRRTAVAMAHDDEIKGREWTIPAARMKRIRKHRNKDHLVPITDALAEHFGEGKGFKFSSDGGKTGFSGFAKAKRALDTKIAAIRKQRGRKPMKRWTLHDLRRTARTRMSSLTTPDVAERVIGHVIGGVRGVYDLHEYADEKRAALDKLAEHVDTIMQGKG